MRRFNTIIESANPPGINQLWIDKKKLRYFAEGRWQLLTGGGGGSSEPPEISNHDTWIIDGVDTGKPSRGEKGAKGDNGLTPYINGSGNWQIGLVDTGVRAAGIDGQNGLTPYINTDKNWWIGTTNTGIKAEGKDGTDGTNGTNGTNGLTPFIGVNKNWWIGSTDTGILAEGKDGINGTNGTDGAAAGIEEAYATAESVSNNAPAEATVVVTGPDTAKVFTFHFKIPKGKDGSGGGGTGVDGKTPILQIGNVTTVAPSGQATANVRYTSDDPDGNPIYAIDFGIPSGVKGDDGNDGVDGKTPVFEIGTTTTLPAGSQATVTITSNGVDATGNPKYLINIGIPTGAKGDDGLTPTIGENGNWLIGAVDTGVKALGEDGAVGKTPVFETGEVVTGAAGTAAQVEVVINGVDAGGNPKYLINFTIPRGADGSGGGSSTDRGRILFTLEDYSASYRPEIGLSKILPAVSAFALNDCIIDSTATVRQVTAVSEDKSTANLSDIIYTFPTGGGTGGVTEARVNELIDAKIGDINAILDNINGEVI